LDILSASIVRVPEVVTPTFLASAFKSARDMDILEVNLNNSFSISNGKRNT
jgi:hypothetical protein